jgi:hypothetical protein
MLAFFILGIGLFIAMMLMAKWYASADTKVVMKVLKWGLITLFAGAGLFFLLTGRLAWAFMAIPALLPWLLRLRMIVRAGKAFSQMTGAFRPSGKTSDVETTMLNMSLDHDSGQMSGTVLKGDFEGRRIEDLNLPELVVLLEACQSEDMDAARILETFLDRQHTTWRDEYVHSSEHQDARNGNSSAMDRSEAFKVLGLEEGADHDAIKEAHRRLIANLHPDHGGSDYLAAKINQAKDLLLKG